MMQSVVASEFKNTIFCVLQDSNSESDLRRASGQPFFCKICKQTIKREGPGKHDVMWHKEKTRVLRCPVCSHCEVWYQDFIKHLQRSHPEESIKHGGHYYVEGVPVFKV